MKFWILDFGFWIGAPLMATLLGGCITRPQNPAATQPVTALDPMLAQPAYWMDQPPIASASHADFQTLWNASEDVIRDDLMEIDRVDYRLGLLSSEPKVSPQFFELWRRDIGTNYDVAKSSLATIRRTAQFEFSRDENSGIVTVWPKVLVERQSQPERRITSVVQYRAALSPNPSERGSRERDAGLDVPTKPYWYAIGRDNELERKLAEAIEQKVRQEGKRQK